MGIKKYTYPLTKRKSNVQNSKTKKKKHMLCRLDPWVISLFLQVWLELTYSVSGRTPHMQLWPAGHWLCQSQTEASESAVPSFPTPTSQISMQCAFRLQEDQKQFTFTCSRQQTCTILLHGCVNSPTLYCKFEAIWVSGHSTEHHIDTVKLIELDETEMASTPRPW